MRKRRCVGLWEKQLANTICYNSRSSSDIILSWFLILTASVVLCCVCCTNRRRRAGKWNDDYSYIDAAPKLPFCFSSADVHDSRRRRTWRTTWEAATLGNNTQQRLFIFWDPTRTVNRRTIRGRKRKIWELWTMSTSIQGLLHYDECTKRQLSPKQE